MIKVAVEAYIEKFDLYSAPNQDTYMDRVYSNRMRAPLGSQKLERVGEVLDAESPEVREQVKDIVEKELSQ